ncbi:MAG: hypothetical protein BIFFINMI_03426 [Phycisphaerae bacterium]|nr:hypothetical protein [Phycisphaerae bacterium]
MKVLRAFAVAQGELGDLPGAMKTAARIESPLDRTWTWSFVAEACGDLAMAEIFDWSATAENYLVGPLARDPEGLLRDHESDSPEEMIDLLARVARDLAGSVSMLRNKNAYWREQEE